ncbi:NADP-dependent oxidoreductase domain-containing protein [Hyaloscypha finlandica]|nr:NADP-dependent oxidoreductase domain-containing protein [Hyaloscypha finlandica]
MTITKTFRLNAEAEMPAIGLATWQSTNEEGVIAVKTAIQAGYRHIDMAWRYGRKRKEVGEGTRNSGVLRSELFLTDKIWGTYHSRAQEALELSLSALNGLFDLEPSREFLKTWQSMENIFLSCPEKVKAIGISNFSAHNLEKLLNIAKVVLTVYQVELHPSLPQEKLAKYCKEKGIQLRGICEIVERYGKSSPQVLISWGVGNGFFAFQNNRLNNQL